MNKWQSQIPKTPSVRDRKRCYRVYQQIGKAWVGIKVVWLNEREKILAHIKYPNRIFDEVLEKDSLEELKKYMNRTIE